MKPAFSLCVYCGSRSGHDRAFIDAARAVGTWIGSHQGQLVYGGGKAGLMGEVAHATAQAGGRVVGIIPEALMARELAFNDCAELHVVPTMHERKRMMAERADAFVALAGALGTLEELFEVWTWRQLGYHDKPIGVLNTAGYYNDLLKFMNQTVQHQFMGESQMGLIAVDTEVQTLLPRLVQQAGQPTASALDAI